VRFGRDQLRLTVGVDGVGEDQPDGHTIAMFDGDLDTVPIPFGDSHIQCDGCSPQAVLQIGDRTPLRGELITDRHFLVPRVIGLKGLAFPLGGYREREGQKLSRRRNAAQREIDGGVDQLVEIGLGFCCHIVTPTGHAFEGSLKQDLFRKVRGMAANELRAYCAGLTHASKVATDAADEIEGLRAKLGTQMDNLGRTWTGQAASAYLSIWAEINDECGEMLGDLRWIGESLSAAAAGYAQMEATGANALGSIAPPANGA
jgi:WXG100 family type VII secretion target